MVPGAGWGICDAKITQSQEIWVLVSILSHGCVRLFTCSLCQRSSGHRTKAGRGPASMELRSESLVLSGPPFPHMEWSVGLDLDRVGKLFSFCFSIILISSGSKFHVGATGPQHLSNTAPSPPSFSFNRRGVGGLEAQPSRFDLIAVISVDTF